MTLSEIWCRAEDGATLHLEGARADRAALLLHGLGYASWAAAPLRDGLGDDLGLWSLDNRGTGRSMVGRREFSIDLFARDAALAITTLGAPLTVIGHSMGGYIAQQLALSRPELVERLVLIGTSAGGVDAVPVPESTRSVWLDAAGAPPEEYARRTMPLSFRAGWPESHPQQYEQTLRARLRHPTSAEVWRAQFDACERFLHTGSRLTALTVPTLVLHGSADRVLPVENGRAIADATTAARYVEVPDGGHLLHIEHADLVADEIRRFISTPSRPT